MKPTFALIHSPLVGPLTWSLVQQRLEERGYRAIVPAIRSRDATSPYRERAVRDVVAALSDVPLEIPLVLVGHSGAGNLLPAIRERLPHTVAGYIFVDAGISIDGLSRLDLVRQESAAFAGQFEQHLRGGGRFPEWRDDDLRELVPDDGLRAALIADLRPQQLDFFTEPIPVFPGWPDAPCAYIQLTPTYEIFAERARADGWPVRRLKGGHFHMLVDPGEVADAILECVFR